MGEINDILAEDVQQLSQPSSLVELYEIDLSSAGGSVFRFVNSTRHGETVKFKGNEYYPIDFETEGWGVSSTGSLPTPKIRISNVGGILTSAVTQYDDLLGFPFTRTRTYDKYLDQFSIRENIVDRIDQFDHVGMYNFGTYYSGRNGEFIISVESGAGITVDFIIVNGVRYNAQDIFDNKVVNVTGTWYPALVIEAWDDSKTWDSSWSEVWDAGLGLAYFSDIPGSSIKFNIEEDVDVEIFVKINETTNENSNMKMNLKTYLVEAMPNINFEIDEFIINQKTIENRVYLEFELASYMDRGDLKLPNRKILKNYCSKQYRTYDSSESSFVYYDCPYNDTALYDIRDNPVFTDSGDVCSKKFSSCRIRFGTSAELPFAGFPGIER